MSERFYRLRLEDWARLRVELAWVYDGPVATPYLEETSPHFGQSIFLVRNGTAKVITEEGQVNAGAGDWVLPQQGQRRQVFSPGTELLSIHLNLHWPGGKPFFDWKTALVFPATKFPRLEIHTKRLERLVQREFPGASHNLRYLPASLEVACRINRHFSAWFEVYCGVLMELGLQPSHLESIDPRILAVAEHLDHGLFGEPALERVLAARAGLSISQFNRLFLKHFGITPRGYFEQRRLDTALVQIRRSRAVKEIAYELGFKSVSHFSAWFRRKTGHTPTDMRAAGMT